jgi:hypothetical protein
MSETPGYASHDTEDGFTVSSNTATAAELAATFAPETEEADPPEPEGSAPPAVEAAPEPALEPTDGEPEKLTPFRKGAKPRDDAFARMKQATDKLAESNRLREAAEARVRELEARQAPPPPAAKIPAVSDTPTGAKFPSFDTYLASHPDASWDDWNDAKIDYVAEAKLTAREQAVAAAAAHAETVRVSQAHGARMAAIGTKYPDYATVRETADRVLAAAGVATLPDALVRAVVTSDRSDDLVYFLGTHPDEAIQLARESADAPASVAPTLRRYLESLLVPRAALSAGSAAPPLRSSAKPPVTPVGGSASATPTALDDLDFGPEYVRRQNAKDLEKGRRSW